MEMIIGIIVMGTIYFLIHTIEKMFLNYFKLSRNILIKNETYKDLKELNREIDVKYSPAVLSYLMNQKLETQKDVVATLLNLVANKVIEIKKVNDDYVFLAGENENKYEELGEDEKYLFLHFIYKNEFNKRKWKKYVRDEDKKYEFSEKMDKETRSIKISIIVILMCILVIPINFGIRQVMDLGGVIWFVSVLIAIGIGAIWIDYQRFIDEEYDVFLNVKGEEEVKKWLRFKKFIEEYTLIEDRTIGEIQIYEKYIPYSMALNINKEYKGLELFNKEEIQNLLKDNI